MIIYTALTCRTRGAIGSVCKRVHQQEHTHLWLKLIEQEIDNSLSVKNIDGYAFEVATLKYSKSDENLSKSNFIELIQMFNKKIPANVPVMWITHYNPKLSPSHKKYMQDRDVSLSADDRIESRTNTIRWLKIALKECPRSLVFDPTQLIETDSSEIYVMKENGLDTNHLPSGGSPISIKIHNGIITSAKKHFHDNITQT